MLGSSATRWAKAEACELTTAGRGYSRDVRILRAASVDLGSDTVRALHTLFVAAFVDGFTPEDAAHAFGGIHVVAFDGDDVVAHASAVPRTIVVSDRDFDAGYVEAVATSPARQGAGIGTQVMEALDELIRDRWELGVLSTGRPTFYEKLGWERWRGPSYVIKEQGTVRTEDEDDGLMVLRFGASAAIDLTSPITCYDRPGDAW
jgi:aminoglycoside 2'-N-acetyltransferase I